MWKSRYNKAFSNEIIDIIDKLIRENKDKKTWPFYVEILEPIKCNIIKDKNWLFTDHWAQYFKLALKRKALQSRKKIHLRNKTLDKKKARHKENIKKRNYSVKMLKVFLREAFPSKEEKTISNYLNIKTEPSDRIFYTVLWSLSENPQMIDEKTEWKRFSKTFPQKEQSEIIAIEKHYFEIMVHNIQWLHFFGIQLPQWPPLHELIIFAESNLKGESKLFSVFKQQDIPQWTGNLLDSDVTKNEVKQKCKLLSPSEIYYLINRLELFYVIPTYPWNLLCFFNLLNKESKEVFKELNAKKYKYTCYAQILQQDKLNIEAQFTTLPSTEQDKNKLIEDLGNIVCSLEVSLQSDITDALFEYGTMEQMDWETLFAFRECRNNESIETLKILRNFLNNESFIDEKVDPNIRKSFMDKISCLYEQ